MVIMAGIDQSQEREGQDRINTTLPGAQPELIRQVCVPAPIFRGMLVGGHNIEESGVCYLMWPWRCILLSSESILVRGVESVRVVMVALSAGDFFVEIAVLFCHACWLPL